MTCDYEEVLNVAASLRSRGCGLNGEVVAGSGIGAAVAVLRSFNVAKLLLQANKRSFYSGNSINCTICHSLHRFQHAL